MAGHQRPSLRFLYGPRETLNSPNGNVILGINPGGEEDMSDRLWTPKTAYYSETWTNSEYQLFVRSFVQSTFRLAGSADWKASWDRSLTSNLFPFRSRGTSDLNSADLAAFVAFGRELWQDIFREIQPTLIVAFGALPRDALLAAMRTLKWQVSFMKSYPANQANTKADLYSFKTRVKEGRILLAPHYARGHGVRDPQHLRAMAQDIAPFVAL